MTLYEVIFILLFLGSVLCSCAVLIMATAKHGRPARKLLVSMCFIWGIYLSVLLVSDALARQQVTKFGDNVCFDEMCFAVVDTQEGAADVPSVTPAMHDTKTYVVTIRMTSQSRGRAQSEGGLRGRLYKDGRYFTTSQSEQRTYEATHGSTPKLTQRLDPGQSILSVLVFKIPTDVTHPALTLDHGFTPGYLVIGESPFFHRPCIMELMVR